MLAYFVWAVLAAFAHPGDFLALAGIVILGVLFAVCAVYIRYRGREIKLTANPKAVEEG